MTDPGARADQRLAGLTLDELHLAAHAGNPAAAEASQGALTEVSGSLRDAARTLDSAVRRLGAEAGWRGPAARAAAAEIGQQARRLWDAAERVATAAEDVGRYAVSARRVIPRIDQLAAQARSVTGGAPGPRGTPGVPRLSHAMPDLAAIEQVRADATREARELFAQHAAVCEAAGPRMAGAASAIRAGVRVGAAPVAEVGARSPAAGPGRLRPGTVRPGAASSGAVSSGAASSRAASSRAASSGAAGSGAAGEGAAGASGLGTGGSGGLRAGAPTGRPSVATGDVELLADGGARDVVGGLNREVNHGRVPVVDGSRTPAPGLPGSGGMGGRDPWGLSAPPGPRRFGRLRPGGPAGYALPPGGVLGAGTTAPPSPRHTPRAAASNASPAAAHSDSTGTGAGTTEPATPDRPADDADTPGQQPAGHTVQPPGMMPPLLGPVVGGRDVPWLESPGYLVDEDDLFGFPEWVTPPVIGR